MKPEEDYLDVLQNLEAIVINVWEKHPEMNDNAVARAYEAAFERYRAEVRGREPKPDGLSGLDRDLFTAIMDVCEWRLGRSPSPDANVEPPPTMPVADLVDCLRHLRRSVDRHTRSGGRQGYLTFVKRFV